MQGSVVRSWLCELAARAFEQEGNDLERARALRRGLRRGPLDDRGRDRAATSRCPVITAALYARFDSRGQRRLRRPRSTPRCATSSAATRCRPGGAGRDDADAPTAPENPLVEGLERLPVHPTTLVIFGATGDLAQPQAAAGDLQPRPRGRAARALQPDRRLAQRDGRTRSSAPRPSEAIKQFSRREPDAKVLEALLADVRYVPGHVRRRRRLRARSTQALDEFDQRGRRAAEPRLLPLDRAGVLPGDRRAARRARARRRTTDAEVRGDHREAVRHDARRGRGAQPARAVGLRRGRRSSASTTTWARRPSRT